MAEEDIVSRLQKELGIEERRVKITMPTSFLLKSLELEEEEQEKSVLMDVSKTIDDEIEEVKMATGNMWLTLQNLKQFSKKLREHIEKPLRDNIYVLRKRQKILATDAALLEKETLKALDTFDKLSEEKKKLKEQPNAIGMLNIVTDFKEEKKTIEEKPIEKVEQPTEKPPEVKEVKK